MPRIDVRGLLILMLTGTICITIIMTMTVWSFIGPERVPQTARDNLHELIILMVGIVSGYLAGHRGNNTPPTPAANK